MKTIATFTWLPEADALCMRLGAEGIEAFVPDQHTATANALYGNAIGGIRVQVADEDVERAREILGGGVPPASAGLFACPECGSDAVAYEKYSRRAAFLALLLLGIPLLWNRRRFACRACGHVWKES